MYATPDALLARYPLDTLVQLTDKTESGTYDPAVLAQAGTEADSEVDTYLCARYPVPLQTPPEIIIRLACEIAYYRLHNELADDSPVTRGYKDAVRLLRSIADGRVSLGLAADAEDCAVVVSQPGVWGRHRNGGLR